MQNATLRTVSAQLPANHRFSVLDAWRGVCALLVTVVHIPVAHPFQDAVGFENMQMFVDFFFVLSGFVMCHAYGSTLTGSEKFQGFMIRRFGRVYPLHLAILLGFVGLELVKLAITHAVKMPIDGDPFTGPRSVETLLSNLFLVQSFNLHGMTSWNGPAWSISVEFYAYIVFAMAVLFAGMRTALFAALAVVGLTGLIVFSPNYIFTTHDFGFLRCLYGFFIGCITYQLVVRSAARGIGTLAEIAAVGLLVAFMWFSGKNATSLAAPLVFALVVYVFAFQRGWISRLLLTTPAQALGLWSYSIYMVHMLIFTVEKMALGVVAKKGLLGLTSITTPSTKLWTFGSTGVDAAFFAAQIVLTLIASAMTYALIEDPWRRRFAAIASRREANSLPADRTMPTRLTTPASSALRVARGPGLR